MFSRVFPLSLLLIAGGLSAGGARADGAELYAGNCAGCHGEAGEGNAEMRVPALAALDAVYLTRQAANFRNGLRRVDEDNDLATTMIDLLHELADDDISQIANYLAGLQIPELDDANDPPGFRGRGLFSGCSSCHGARAQGTEALNAPRLSRQYGWYLTEQLLAFRAGQRGFHDDDAPGRQMKSMADAIASDADIAELISYIATLEP